MSVAVIREISCRPLNIDTLRRNIPYEAARLAEFVVAVVDIVDCSSILTRLVGDIAGILYRYRISVQSSDNACADGMELLIVLKRLGIVPFDGDLSLCYFIYVSIVKLDIIKL